MRDISPKCCYLYGEDYENCCDKDAEFHIFGIPFHFEDETHACVDHVGALLGTPDWRKQDNEGWTVYPLPPSSPEVDEDFEGWALRSLFDAALGRNT